MLNTNLRNIQQTPLFLSLSALGLKTRITEILTRASRRGIISIDELLKIIPNQLLGNSEKLGEMLTWITDLCEALDIVILRTSSKSRLEKGVLSGEKINSFKPPVSIDGLREEYDTESIQDKLPMQDPEEGCYLEDLTDFVHEEKLLEEDVLSFYLRLVRSYKILPHYQIVALARSVKEKGDVEARNQIVLHNLRLAMMVGRRYRGRGLEYIDLIQEGNLGLIQAAERFDYERGFRFSTYALWWVRQAIVRAIYNNAQTIRIPVFRQLLWDSIVRISTRFVQQFGREPSPAEIAKELTLPVKEIERNLREMKISTVYLEDLKSQENRDDNENGLWSAWLPSGNGSSLELAPDQLIEAEDELKLACQRMKFFLAHLSSFSNREQNIFRLRFGLDGTFDTKTLDEVGEQFSITKQRVKQIIDKIWLKLRLGGLDIDETWLKGEIYRIERLGDLLGKDVSAIIYLNPGE